MSHLTQPQPTAESAEDRKRKALLRVLTVEKQLLETAFAGSSDPYVKLVVSEKLVEMDETIRANQFPATVERASA